MRLSRPLSLLSATEEAELARRVHGPDAADSLAARNEMVLHNLGLVGKTASYYTRKSTSDYDDLFSEGIVGLIRAVEGYDPILHHTRFSTYASVVIFYGMRDWVQADHTVRVPHWLQEPGQMAVKMRQPRSQRSRRRLDGQVEAARQALAPRTPCFELLDPSPSPLDGLVQHETADRLVIALAELPPLRAYILAHRCGLCGFAEMTLRELAEDLGLSHERIRQLEVKATKELGRALRKRCA